MSLEWINAAANFAFHASNQALCIFVICIANHDSVIYWLAFHNMAKAFQKPRKLFHQLNSTSTRPANHINFRRMTLSNQFHQGSFIVDSLNDQPNGNHNQLLSAPEYQRSPRPTSSCSKSVFRCALEPGRVKTEAPFCFSTKIKSSIFILS